jgi:hypothetical protein
MITEEKIRAHCEGQVRKGAVVITKFHDLYYVLVETTGRTRGMTLDQAKQTAEFWARIRKLEIRTHGVLEVVG